MSEDAIKAEGLTKVFNGSLVAVDHINFSVKHGEIFGFLGPNGAGKTTTINMLITILKPTDGKASILGYDIAKQNNEVRYSIGLVPQEYTADEDLTGIENILLCADLYGIPRDISKKRALDLLDLVELTEFKDKKVQTFSGGMRRRLELACGLINRPKVLFLDEPTLGLDVQTRAATWNYIKTLKKEFGMTLFMTTHYLEEADALCDRIAIIDHGKIIVVGTPTELKDSLGGDIILDENKILLEKRKNSPGKGKWSVPGGLVELGENIEQAVIREVKEETGLDVYEPRLVDVVDHISLGERGAVKYHFVIVDYLVTVKCGKPKAASDADALKWVPFNEVEEYDLTESFRRFFQWNRQRLENPSLYF